MPPLELTIMMGPAFTMDPELLPHPASIISNTARQIAPHRRLVLRPCADRVLPGGNIRASSDIDECILSAPIPGRVDRMSL